MADAAVTHDVAVYEPSLFGTYSKKIGMWLFLLSDSLTFGALLYAYSYGRISITNWPTPFHSGSIINATIMTAFLLTSSLTMVMAVSAAARGKESARVGWLLATMACGIGFIVLHGREWTHLISEGLTLPIFPAVPGQDAASEFAGVSKMVPQFGYFLHADRNAHAARNAGSGLPRHHRAAKKVYPDSARVLARSMAVDPGLQSVSLRGARAAYRGYGVCGDSVAEAQGL